MASPVFTAVSGATVVAVCFAVSGFSFKAGGLTVLLGFANALALLGYNYFIVKASQTGAYSVMMVFSITGCITVSALTAHFAFGDKLSVFKILVLACQKDYQSKNSCFLCGNIRYFDIHLCFGCRYE